MSWQRRKFPREEDGSFGVRVAAAKTKGEFCDKQSKEDTDIRFFHIEKRRWKLPQSINSDIIHGQQARSQDKSWQYRKGGEGLSWKCSSLGNPVPSLYTLKYLRSYFRDESLPDPGTVCRQDCNLFDGPCFEEGNVFADRLYE